MRFLLVSALVLLQHSALHSGWTSQPSGTTQSLSGVYFIDAARGWTVGYNGTILQTTDGGVTWSPQASGTITALRDVHFVDANNGWTVGGTGLILHTTDAGATWLYQSSGTTSSFEDVCFIDAGKGWAVGSNGTILRTIDAGENWFQVTSGTLFYLTSVHFIDSNTGWVTGLEGTIRRTTDGGTTWSGQASGTISPLWDVYFTDANTGWVVGIGGIILHTTNGGTTWIEQSSGMAPLLFDVYFTDTNTGWSVGGEGVILHTTDGGTTWLPQTSGVPYYLTSVQFIDENTGWASGFAGTILHYTKNAIPCDEIDLFKARCDEDGTARVVAALLQSTEYAGDTVEFRLDDEVYAVELVTNGTHTVGRLRVPQGGVGEHTASLVTPAGCRDPITFNCQLGDKVTDSEFETTWEMFGASAGEHGLTDEIPGTAVLYDNYPNPFNPITTIRYSLPRAGAVSLKVFNLLGEEVASLVSGHQEPGQYAVEWDATGQPSGVYVYQLQAGGVTETKKLVLLR